MNSLFCSACAQVLLCLLGCPYPQLLTLLPLCFSPEPAAGRGAGLPVGEAPAGCAVGNLQHGSLRGVQTGFIQPLVQCL